MRGQWEAGAGPEWATGGVEGDSFFTHYFFLIFKLCKCNNAFTGDLENAEQSHIQFHSILQVFKWMNF